RFVQKTDLAWDNFRFPSGPLVQHHLETNRLTGFNTLKFHCWLNTLLNDFYHLNHWVNFNCDLLLTLAI
ncbi:hypothetical protein OUQ87_005307, partial [Klebsiella variicola]|uniref:hypothetical protein n=1 Tax=Enterobacter cloacae TaxID=550 RepID=UPI002549E0FC